MEKRGESMEIWNSTTEFSSTVYDDFLSLLDMPGENGSSCFTDSMGFQDLNPSLFAFQQQTSPTPVLTSTTSTLPDSPDVLNNPTTPNCSSISSSSTERGKTTEVDAEEEDEDKSSKKHLKPNKKNGKKRQRERRFAFMTKSDVDHLDDSYRWRKYGQKAVKDSPFPRSYYRCTTATCGVKKRIERSSEDPTIVVTTYEGQHTHPVPGTSSRGSSIYHSTTPVQTPQIHHQQHHQHQQQQQQQYPYLTSLASNPLNLSSTTTFDQNRCFGSTNATTASWFQDYGLLQDIVPAVMRREV